VIYDELDKNHNIVIWEKIIKKWSDEYNWIMEKIFKSIKIFAEALIRHNAKEKAKQK